LWILSDGHISWLKPLGVAAAAMAADVAVVIPAMNEAWHLDAKK